MQARHQFSIVTGMIALLALSACKSGEVGGDAPASGGGDTTTHTTPVHTCTAHAGTNPTFTPTSTSGIAYNGTVAMTASGGVPPYTYSIVSGGGAVEPSGTTNNDTATFHAIASGTTVVKVTDDYCNSATASVAVIKPAGTKIPNDTYWSMPGALAGLMKIVSSTTPWKATNADCSNVNVAIIDTGMDYNHEDLAANVNSAIAGKNYYDSNNANDPMDDNFHGTHVSGIIGAVGNNSLGGLGICWKAKLTAIKFLGPSGSGTTSGAVQAIDYARDVGIHIINASWGGLGFDQSLSDAISRTRDAGMLFVAAAGNSTLDLETTKSYPASYNIDNIIVVASTDNLDGLSSFSNYGSATVNIAAPGENIRSTVPMVATNAMITSHPSIAAKYALLSGTSMATPFITGIAALIWSNAPYLKASDVRSRVIKGGVTAAALTGKLAPPALRADLVEALQTNK